MRVIKKQIQPYRRFLSHLLFKADVAGKTIGFILIAVVMVISAPLSAQINLPDSADMVIDKKFTITFQDKIKLKNVKKTPRLKRVHVVPERNPITYNKQAFYQSLKIKQSKSLEELFTYPLFSAYLGGGNLRSINAGINFQANAGNFIPALSWNFDQLETDQKNSQRRRMDFLGGIRLHLSKSVTFNLDLNHIQQVNGNVNFSGDSVTSDFKGSLTHIALGGDFNADNFNFSIGTSIEDFYQEYLSQLHVQQTGLNLLSLASFNGFAIKSSGNLNFVTDDFDDNEDEYSWYHGTMEAVYTGSRFQVSGGVDITGYEFDNVSRGETTLKPAAGLTLVILPEKLSFWVNYSGGIQPFDLQETLNRFLFTGNRHSRPDILDYQVKSGIDFRSSSLISYHLSLEHKNYDRLNIWIADSTSRLFGRHTLLNETDPIKENSIFLSTRVKMKQVDISAGGSFTVWTLPGELEFNPLLPNQSVFLKTEYSFGKGGISTSFTYSGKRSQAGTKENLEAISLWNGEANYNFYKKFTAHLYLNNILNQEYEYVPGFTEPGLRGGLKISYKW